MGLSGHGPRSSGRHPYCQHKGIRSEDLDFSIFKALTPYHLIPCLRKLMLFQDWLLWALLVQLRL